MDEKLTLRFPELVTNKSPLHEFKAPREFCVIVRDADARCWHPRGTLRTKLTKVLTCILTGDRSLHLFWYAPPKRAGKIWMER